MISLCELMEASDIDSNSDCKIKIPWDNAIDYSSAEYREEFSYNNLVSLANRARDTERGKYMSSWCRIKLASKFNKDTGFYKIVVVRIHGYDFLHIHPDNTAEVVTDSPSYVSTTLVHSLGRIFPIIVWRHRTDLYRITHDFGFIQYLANKFNSLGVIERRKHKEMSDNYELWSWKEKHMRTYGSVFKKGLIIDLNTGEITNRDHSLEPVKAVEDKDKRKVWRANITRAKRSLRVALKLGVFEKLWEKAQELSIVVGNSYWNTPSINWHDEDRVKELAEAVSLKALPTPIFNSIIYSVMSRATQEYSYTSYTTAEKNKLVEGKLNTFFNELSTPLRKHLGVITKEATYSSTGSAYSHGRSLPIEASNPVTAKLLGTQEDAITPLVIQNLLDGKFKVKRDN